MEFVRLKTVGRANHYRNLWLVRRANLFSIGTNENVEYWSKFNLIVRLTCVLLVSVVLFVKEITGLSTPKNVLV